MADTTTYSTEKVQAIVEMTTLVREIVALTEAIKERETLLASRKKRLAEILPEEGFRVQDEADPTKVIEAKWVDKLTKTLQKALVEQNHGIVLTEEDYKQTPSHYPNVAKVKA